jgi:hypothetical protein
MAVKDGKIMKTLVPCERCPAKVMFAHRPQPPVPPPAPDAKPDGLVKPQRPVQVPLNARNDGYLVIYTGSADKPVLWAITGVELLDKVEKIILKNGKEITGNQLVGLYSSHFGTCPAAAHFSRKK